MGTQSGNNSAQQEEGNGLSNSPGACYRSLSRDLKLSLGLISFVQSRSEVSADFGE